MASCLASCVCIKTADQALCWHTWHALLANYIISCYVHSCGVQVTLGLEAMQVMAMAFTA